MNDSNYLREVRMQYENYPYPPRDPEDERKRLIPNIIDKLPIINHFCFRGTQYFGNSFRVLVAGGGTGDSAIFLAEQLKGTNATVTYVDISTASMDIAKKRAEVRGLQNIEWHLRSLLELPEMDLAPFDYINCIGVLHHLEDPVAGLKALRSVLKEDGAIGLMLYATYGRTPVYQMQDLMRLINTDEPDLQVKVDNTKKVLASLPVNHALKTSETDTDDHINFGDVGIYDLFLHSQDRSYTVPEVYEYLKTCNLNPVSFVYKSLLYRPETFITDKTLLEKIRLMPVMEQQSIAELLCGKFSRHFLYASPHSNTIADLNNMDNVPFLCGMFSAGQLYDYVRDKRPDDLFTLDLGFGRISLPVGYYCESIFQNLDGQKSVRELLDIAVAERKVLDPSASREKAFHEFSSSFQLLNILNQIVLRGKTV
ncbi:MAG: class I SAM-dependent methyltransferase [Gammaproteobacteria bacterium]|nr:MAG: class I SAM-dependent methyltransferase [Gammaproteobacteria bacterium]